MRAKIAPNDRESLEDRILLVPHLTLLVCSLYTSISALQQLLIKPIVDIGRRAHCFSLGHKIAGCISRGTGEGLLLPMRADFIPSGSFWNWPLTDLWLGSCCSRSMSVFPLPGSLLLGCSFPWKNIMNQSENNALPYPLFMVSLPRRKKESLAGICDETKAKYGV